jgi:3-phenylpropionate/trans-cinnamate dioxygenase ferredoxin reductase subunit
VQVSCGSRVLGFEGTDRLEAVACAEGRFRADAALIGIGAVPNSEVAQRSGIACDDGILVDDHCRTSAPGVYAAGDCTRHPSEMLGRLVRLESVQNAVDQAQVAAMNMCGADVANRRVPTFWSQQYEFRLQSAGHFQEADEIEERGDRAAGAFALLYRRAGALVGVDAVNLPREYLAARKRLSGTDADASDHVRTA